MRTILSLITLLCLLPQPARARQVIAGSPEDKAFQHISAETNSDLKLQQLMEYEKQFPKSGALPNVYLIAIDIYREKGDQTHVIEYGEKALALDQKNVTALMVLSRNYAMQGKNIDRAVELAQRAVEVVGNMKTQPAPASYTESGWKTYLQTTAAAAQSILDYTKMVKGREQAISRAADHSTPTEAAENKSAEGR